jgi:hypothetical protein
LPFALSGFAEVKRYMSEIIFYTHIYLNHGSQPSDIGRPQNTSFRPLIGLKLTYFLVLMLLQPVSLVAKKALLPFDF